MKTRFSRTDLHDWLAANWPPMLVCAILGVGTGVLFYLAIP